MVRMRAIPSDLYASWRALVPIPAGLQDAASGTPDERLLQQIWRHQRLRRPELRTLDGRPLAVLHPGFWNREAGPDFRRAVIQFANDPPLTGDIEVDLEPGGWHQHGHDVNPAFREVRLHVVWAAPKGHSAPLPVVALHGALDAPLTELAGWLGSAAADHDAARWQLGRCSAGLTALPLPVLTDLLFQAGRARLEYKAGQVCARAREVGWEPALWEALLAALGYKHNAWPMRQLAELRPRLLQTDAGKPPTTLVTESRLLGVAGLLPTDLAPRTGERHLRELWDIWWRDRAALEDCILPRSIWHFHGIRPANHPHRRLALAARWLANPRTIDALETWAAEPTATHRLVESLLRCLLPEPDEFWDRRWSLSTPAGAQRQPLLGPGRATEVAVNAILPWFHARAAAGGNTTFQRQIEEQFTAWPAAEDNAVLRLARQRLFGTARPHLPRRAALQQGLQQVVRDFCNRTNSLCDGCRFPALVATVPVSGP